MVVFRRSGGIAFEAAFQPALGEKQRFCRIVARRVAGGAFVECHHDIGSDGALGVDDVFGGEEVARAVDMGAETAPLFGQLAALREREYLETAAVCQHRFVPCAETVDASRRFDDLHARPQVEMVGVGEDDARSRFGQVAVENAFDARGRADRHEDGSLDGSVVGGEPSRPGRAACRPVFHFKSHCCLTRLWFSLPKVSNSAPFTARKPPASPISEQHSFGLTDYPYLWRRKTESVRSMEIRNLLDAKSRRELRAWLSENHRREKECWVAVRRGRPVDDGTFWYVDAVEEALCFGWIDSTVKKLPSGATVQRLCPRRPGSAWSELNKERCRRLERLGLMTDAGRAVLPDMTQAGFVADEDILQALRADPVVWEHFCGLPELYRRVRIDTIRIKRKEPELFRRRLEKFVECTRAGILYGEWNDNGRLWSR